MIIRILSSQISVYWDVIKFCIKAVESIEEKDLQAVYNELLHALLSDKAQCFVSFNEQKVLGALLITRISMDKVTDEKYLLFQTIYAWDKLSDKDWKDGFNLVRQLAEKEHCRYLSCRSSNPRIWDMATTYGLKEKYRTFEARI